MTPKAKAKLIELLNVGFLTHSDSYTKGFDAGYAEARREKAEHRQVIIYGLELTKRRIDIDQDVRDRATKALDAYKKGGECE